MGAARRRTSTTTSKPLYIVTRQEEEVAELKRALKDATELYLATDEDREGEAIAWHLLEVLKPKVPVKRMVFHEITREAIHAPSTRPATSTAAGRRAGGPAHPRPPLRLRGVARAAGSKVRAGCRPAACRSVATRLVVERERERMAFVARVYWDLVGTFPEPRPAFEAPRSSRSTAGASPAAGTSATTASLKRTSLALDEDRARTARNGRSPARRSRCARSRRSRTRAGRRRRS